MKSLLMIALPLTLCACLGQETTRARYEADQQQQNALAEKASKVEVFWTTRPDKPYSEIGLVSVRTSDDAQETRRLLQVETAKLDANAVIITGNHGQTRDTAINLTGTETMNFMDGVDIKWKP